MRSTWKPLGAGWGPDQAHFHSPLPASPGWLLSASQQACKKPPKQPSWGSSGGGRLCPQKSTGALPPPPGVTAWELPAGPASQASCGQR